MNEIVNKFLLAGDKVMPEIHLKQPGFAYIACGPFTKNKERIQKFKERGDTNYIHKNELHRACFQHDMAYGDFKDYQEEQVLINFREIKHLILQKILSMVDIKEDWLLWFISFLIKNLLQIVGSLIIRLNKPYN